MPSHSEKRIVSYSSGQIFNLVMDIEKYPEFLPWCISAVINKRGKRKLEADVVIGYKIFREKFSSKVSFTQDARIDVEYISGPMSYLKNNWRFKDMDNGCCEVSFYVEFSMKSRLLDIVVNQLFDRALKRMINAFEERAEEIY